MRKQMSVAHTTPENRAVSGSRTPDHASPPTLLPRRLEPELLDLLPPEAPQAVGSRRDLRRLNAWMGNAATTARALLRAFPHQPPRRLVDLGAGDGTFLLQVAARLPPTWRPLHVVLLDRQDALSSYTRQAFETRGWQMEFLKLDVFDWLQDTSSPPCDAIVTNLFLHHLPDPALHELLHCAAERTRAFVAVEPRRSTWTRVFCRLVWLLGCNAVTCHDARISVAAGFAGNELSRHWPATRGWSLHEGPAGCFSHELLAWQPAP
jgi:hypothetical protein